MNARKLFSILLVCVLMTALLAGLATVSTTAKTTTNVTNTTTGKNLANSTVKTGNSTVKAGNEKHIIFRDDDIAPWSDLSTLKIVNQAFIDENVPETLAITPHPSTDSSDDNQNELYMDTSMLNYLLSIKTNPLFEFAQHGYTHATGGVGSTLVSGGSTAWHPSADRLNGSTRLVGATLVGDSEYSGRPYTDQYNSIKHGWDDIAEALGVKPRTFVPPWNDGDSNTVLAAHAVGHTLYSSGDYDPAMSASVSGIYLQGADFEIPWQDVSWDAPMSDLTTQTDAALNAAGIGADFVVLTHFWSYTADTTSNTAIDWHKIILLEAYIEHLKARGDVEFTTLDNQYRLSESAKTNVTLTASNTNPGVGQSDTLTGTLTHWDSTQNKWVALANEPVQIWHVEPNYYRTDDATVTTDSKGNFSFTTSWSTTGKRPYSATFDDDESNYRGSLSYPVNVTVVPKTTLTATASTTTPAVNQNFTINGTLSANGNGIGSATITLKRSTDNATWNNVTTNVTNATGGYLFSRNESANGTYYYRTSYSGGPIYGNSTSNVVNVTVHAGEWGPWTSLGGQILAGTSPAACSPASGQTDWFVVGTNHQLYYTSNGGLSWISLGGSITSSPAAVSPSAGVIDVFVRGTNGALYTKHYSGGSWGAWTSLGGQLPAGTSPAACSWGASREDVFVQGTNGALYQTTWTGSGWSAWANLGGALTSSPAATTPASGVMDVFARGTNGALYQKHYSGGSWGAWTSLGGQLPAGTSPAACSWGASREDVFVQGTNGALYQTTWTGSGWSAWANLGGQLTSSPAATSPASGVIDIGVRGTNGALYVKVYM
jgi:hypothetical protein